MKSVVFLCIAFQWATVVPVVAALRTTKDTLMTRNNHDDLKEELVEQIESETGASSLIDHLQWLEENPYDLNSVTGTELEALPGVTPAEARLLIEFRKRIKKFTSVGQVEIIEGIGSGIFQKIRNYVVISSDDANEGGRGRRRVAGVRTRASQNLQSGEDAAYRGTLLKSYSRVVITPSEALQAGVLFEKDPGEQFGDGFVSGYFIAKELPIFSELVAGDFTLESGQGLVFWSSSAFGKGSDVVGAIRKSRAGIRPYRSSDEFHFFRGAAAAFNVKTGTVTWDLTVAVSMRNLAGSIDNDGTITGLYEEGLFRTDAEITKRNKINERLIGGTIHAVSGDNWKVGGSYSHASYNTSFAADHVFDFTGNHSGVFGIDGQWTAGRLSLFGEAAQSEGGRRAGIGGCLFQLNRMMNIAFAYRNYSPGFHSLHAAGFGEYDRLNNERGYYIGLEAAVTHGLKLKGYIDQFSSPWRTATSPLPSAGTDMLLQADVKATSRFEISSRYSRKKVASIEPAVDENTRELRLQVDRIQDRGRLNVSYQISKSLRVKGRIEATSVAYPGVGKYEKGYLIFQDLHYRGNADLFVQFRLIFFQTDSYDSRVYEYENDLRGVSSIPALFGRGRRYYLLVGYSLGGTIAVSAKYAETQKDDVILVSIPSSGIDSRLSVQLDIAL